MLVSQLYVCIILTCYLTDFSGLDTCVCWFTCEYTNLVAFLSLFSVRCFSYGFLQFPFLLINRTVFVVFLLLHFTLCPFETKGGSNFVLDRDCIFKLVKWFFSRMAKWGVCLFVIAAFCWIKSLQGWCLYSKSTFQLCASWRLCAEFKAVNVKFLASVRMESSNIRLDDKIFLSRVPSVSKSFELFQVASVRTSQQHVWTPFIVQQVKWFPFQTQIWEDSWNCPENVVIPSGRYPW